MDKVDITSTSEAVAEDLYLSKLNKDLKQAVSATSREEVAFLVETYYQIQGTRLRLEARTKALVECNDPHAMADYASSQASFLERQLSLALDIYSRNQVLGRWLRSHTGIGPVLASALLAGLDHRESETAGGFWRYCGMDSSRPWLDQAKAKNLVDSIIVNQSRKKELSVEQVTQVAVALNTKLGRLDNMLKQFADNGELYYGYKEVIRVACTRPFNAALKVTMFKIGDSFARQSWRKHCKFGRLYLERKIWECEKNERGLNAMACQEALERNPDGPQADWYSGCFSPADVKAHRMAESQGKAARQPEDVEEHNDGEENEEGITFWKPKNLGRGNGVPMLPPSHVERRTRRYVTKIFISHFHTIGYPEVMGVPAPAPFALEQLHHAHLIKPEPLTDEIRDYERWKKMKKTY